MKISTRLLLLFMVVAVLPLALFSYLNLQQEEETLRLAELDEMSNLAGKKVIQVRNYLTEREREVCIRARGPQVMEGMGKLQKLYFAGRHSAAYMREDAKLHHYFERYVEEYGLFYDAILITPQGEVVFSQKHDSDFASNLLNGPYRDTQLAQAFRSARMTLEPVVSGYEHYAPSQAPAMFIVAPIMIEGEFKGVFAVQLGNELLYRVATDATGLGMSGEAAFAQRDGAGVLFTTPLKYHPDAALKFRLDLQQLKTMPMFGALSGESGAGVKPDYRGKLVVAAWRYLPELDWGMVVKEDADEVFVPIAQQRMLLLGILLGLLLFAGLIAYYFGHQISVSLDGLAETADEVAKGNLDKRADESAPGELGLFARAFNHMAENLQGLYRTLEDRIEERTRELNMTNEQLQEEIVERERTAAVLRGSESFLRTIFETEPECVKVIDRNGQLLEMNAAGLAMLEADSVAEVQQQTLTNLILTEYRAPFVDLHKRVMRGESGVLQFEITGLKGSRRWLETHAAPMRDASGKVTMLLGITRDISTLKKSEMALRIAAATFETHEGIMITDAQANIVRVNRAFQEITGYSAEEVIGKNQSILSSGRQGKEFYDEMWRQLLAEGGWSGEIWDRRKNGEIYPKWMTISAVKDEGGQVTEYVAIFSDITARKRAEEEIRSLAFYDALTGLPNRRLLLDRFQLALPLSARSHYCGALLFLDMDKFKTLNDTLGHDYGDLLLIEVGRRIQACVRETDTVARLGGDEFVVLIEEIGANMEESSQKVALIAEKIRTALSAPYKLKEHEVHSSPSIGVSMYRGSAESIDTLMKYADMAMYQAKDSGRNAVRFFDPQMQQAIELHAQLEADLRRALPDKQMQLYYQIQVDGDLRPIGAEALIRWMHPQRGMISPAQFIPVAEESSLILDIGLWVIDTACRQLAAWVQDEQMSRLVLAVNVSAQQFRLHDFVGRLEEMIARHGIAPERLKLELTESVVLENVTDVVGKMHALKALGVRLSLDDFGTGYSSLAYLKQLPLDQIKIDQSFVRDIISDPNDAVMVKAIIDMAQNFRLNVIAEGVETEAQLAFLKQNDCMAYQGYLFGRPVPVAELEVLVRRLFG